MMKHYYAWGPDVCEGDGNTASRYQNWMPENTASVYSYFQWHLQIG